MDVDALRAFDRFVGRAGRERGSKATRVKALRDDRVG
jgi:hypothetical protein